MAESGIRPLRPLRRPRALGQRQRQPAALPEPSFA